MIDIKKELNTELDVKVKMRELTSSEAEKLKAIVHKNMDIIREMRENGLRYEEIIRLLDKLYLYGR